MQYPCTSRCGRRSAMRLLIIAASFIAVTAALALQPGDHVKLTRNEPLYFQDKILREGKADDTFVVLVHRLDLKKVFVSSSDADGKQIALSVAEEAVIPVPVDSEKVKREAIAALKNRRFSDAQRAVSQALASNPTDPDLLKMKEQIASLQAASQKVVSAREDLKRASQAATLKRKNAMVADRPNRLNPRDRSGHDRAEKMRAEASQIEKEAKQSVEEASAEYQHALIALTGADGPVPIARNAPPAIPGLRSPDSARNPVSRPDGAKLAEEDVTQALLQKWSVQNAVIPPDLHHVEGPSYTETIEYINSHVGPFVRIGYHAEPKKMAIATKGWVVVFDPKDLNAAVKYSTETRFGVTSHNVILESRNRVDSLLIYEVWFKPNKVPYVNEGKQASYSIRVADEIDAKKVATAFSHLIALFGGKADAF